MELIHSGATYECSVAVKCESDKYIKLYDAAGVEIASFNGISDFAEFELSGGSFISPSGCTLPIPLTAYAIGGRTITTNDWILADGRFYYEIESALISGNEVTCNIMLLFAEGTELEYEAVQADGKLILYTAAAPLYDVVIDAIQITRV